MWNIRQYGFECVNHAKYEETQFDRLFASYHKIANIKMK